MTTLMYWTWERDAREEVGSRLAMSFTNRFFSFGVQQIDASITGTARP
jgi:hypothetical protein